MLERTANFGQTGNARVFNVTLMDQLLLSTVARRGTLPYLGPMIQLNECDGPLAFVVDIDRWPLDPFTSEPLSSALASLVFHYGTPLAAVSTLIILLTIRRWGHDGHRLCDRAVPYPFCTIRRYLLDYPSAFVPLHTPAQSLTSSSQFYHAMFSMLHIYRHSASCPGYQPYRANKPFFPVIAMFHACFTHYVRETTDFIEESVKQRTMSIVQANNGRQTSFTKNCLKYLKDWVSLPRPFANTPESLGPLLLALRTNGNVPDRLPGSENFPPLTLKEFANATLQVARSSRTASLHAPFLSKSLTVGLLRVALMLAEVQLGDLEAALREKLMCQAISIVVEHHKIHNVPWAPAPVPGDRRSRSRTYRPSIASWRVLDTTITDQASITRNLIMQSSDPLAITRLNIDAANSISAAGEWRIAAVPLADLRRYSNKTVNPVDFVLKHASVESRSFLDPNSPKHYIYRHYMWVTQNLNVKKPPHRLILYCARIFAATAPYLAIEPNFVAPPNTATNEEFVRVFQSIPLITPPRKGVTQALPLIVLFTGMALGLLHSDSPLSQRLGDPNGRGSLGAEWTEKHGTPRSRTTYIALPDLVY